MQQEMTKSEQPFHLLAYVSFRLQHLRLKINVPHYADDLQARIKLVFG